MRLLSFFLLICSFIVFPLVAQHNLESSPKNYSREGEIVFKRNSYQVHGFDDASQKAWNSLYDTLPSPFIKTYRVPVKSVAFQKSDFVNAVIRKFRQFDPDSLQFVVEETGANIAFQHLHDSVYMLTLPAAKFDYAVLALYRGKIAGKLNVVVYGLKTEKLIVVPLVDKPIRADSLRQALNAVYRQANLQFEVYVKPVFKAENFDQETIFNNPSPQNDRYTEQMQECRRLYFEQFPTADRNANYIFVIEGFVDPKLRGYMVRNKSIGFVKYTEEPVFSHVVARQLGFGIGILNSSWKENGPQAGSTNNLMDLPGGEALNVEQWEAMRHGSHSYSMYDNYEDVRTNSGLIAYYFWRENPDGTIILDKNDFLSSIKRPYKKNFMSYHLDIQGFFFQTAFTFLGFLISYWHLIAIVLIYLFFYLFSRWFRRFLSKNFTHVRFWKLLSRLGFFFVATVVVIWSFFLINEGYRRFEVKAGVVNDLFKMSTKQAINSILTDEDVSHQQVQFPGSEILSKRADKWYVRKRKKVLYFSAVMDSLTQKFTYRYSTDSDSLKLHEYSVLQEAKSHYLIVDFFNEKRQFLFQKIYNHLGIDLTDKLLVEDPAKRILVLVNGYRPTSVGHTFEENFNDIKNNGLEYPATSNMIYNFDRYDYWRPWGEMDLLFKKRLNPSEMYYADGHYSVSTSNHESLIDFTKLASVYPQRCKNKNHHTCYYTKVANSFFGTKTVKTRSLLRLNSNKEGFKERMEGGRIAGRNLMQLLNELPNRSENDTIYIVAHSMGYAYALGMLEVIRGHIQLGNFYILAPENAAAGKVNRKEWQEVWQYGSKLSVQYEDAPCLQDGVAAQVCASGLLQENRIFIPEAYYKRKGFYDSHFVGYYTWMFDIPDGQKGHIRQY